VKVFLSRILNVVITVLSLYYVLIVVFYIYSSINTNISVSLVGRLGFMEVLQIIILFASTIYYFKTNHRRMKIISSIGCISMIIVLTIVNGLM